MTEHLTDERRRPTGRFDRAPRPRQELPDWAKPLARPFFRYSYSRDAYILRAVGDKRGPVLLDLEER